MKNLDPERRVHELLEVAQDRKAAAAPGQGCPLHLAAQPRMQEGRLSGPAAGPHPPPLPLPLSGSLWNSSAGPGAWLYPAVLSSRSGGCPGPGWGSMCDVGGSSWPQHWRRGGGDTECLDYEPSQTQDTPTAPQTGGAARWSMAPTSRVSDQTRDLPAGLGHSSGLAMVKLGEREGVHQRLLPTSSHTQKHTQTQDTHRPLKTRTHKHIQTHKRQQATTRRFTNTITHRNIWKHKTDTYTNTPSHKHPRCLCMQTHKHTQADLQTLHRPRHADTQKQMYRDLQDRRERAYTSTPQPAPFHLSMSFPTSVLLQLVFPAHPTSTGSTRDMVSGTLVPDDTISPPPSPIVLHPISRPGDLGPPRVVS